jgi:hypothetical protein
MERIGRSWSLVKSSWGVLRQDRELLLFPIASGIVTLVALAVVLVIWFGSGGFDRAEQEAFGLIDLVLLYLAYFVISTVVIFFNSALVAAANIRLQGGEPTLGDGFRIALSHLPSILGWAAISATVGIILQLLRERGGAVGAIVSLIGNLAWSLITFLVVPILVIEGVGPVEAIKRSGSLLRKTWGEQLVGAFSIGLVMGLVILALIVGGGAVTFLAFSVSEAIGVLLAIIVVIAVVIVGLISSALSGIFNVALYRYAVGEHSDQFFPQETLSGAFRPNPSTRTGG